MKKHWIVSLVLLVIAAGCGPTETPERAAQDALQDQKVRAALAKQTRGSMSMPKELGPEDAATPEDSKSPEDKTPEDSATPEDKTQEDSATPEDSDNPEDTATKTDPTTEESNKSKDADGDQSNASPKLKAQQVLDEAVAKANAEDKALFVHFTADWWGWCHKLEEFLESNDQLFADDYHFVAIDTVKMDGGKDVMNELKKDRQGGMPWMVILDGEGNELISSVGPNGNVGCPVTPEEIAHFVDMIKQSSDASEEDLTNIREAMDANAKKIRGK